MTETLYNTHPWRTARESALARDGRRCTVSRLLGGRCSLGPLHVHHILAVADGGDRFDVDNLGTTCATHHPMWEALRRTLVKRLLAGPPRCTHQHRSVEARRICERRLARQRSAVAA